MNHVLFVDDDSVLLDVAKLWLEDSQEFTVDTATSAKNALKLENLQKYDAIISDYDMPGLNGIEFLKQIRASGNKNPFILFTGKGREEVVIEAITHGADFYLQKGGEAEAQFVELIHQIKNAVQRHKADDALRANEERMRMAQAVGQIGSWEYDIKANTIWGSEEGFRLFGTPRPENGLISINEIEIVIPERDRVHKALEHLLQTGGKYDIEYRILPRDGSPERIVHSVARRICDDKGLPVKVSGVIQDITERKRAETRLRESEERFRALIQNSSDIIRILDKNGRIIYSSPSTERILGFPEEDLIGHSPLEYVHPDDLAIVRTALDTVYNKTNPGTYTEFRIRKKSGDYIDVESIGMNLIGVQGIDGIVTTTRPITERKRNEETQKQSERKYRLLADNVTDVIWTADMDMQLTYVSPSINKLRGYSPEEVMAEKIEDALTPESYQVLMRSKESGMNKIGSGKPPFAPQFLELEQRCRDGSTVWTEVSISLVFDVTGKPEGVIGVSRDISARRQTEMALKKSERNYRSLIENIQDPVYQSNVQGQLVFASPSLARLMDYKSVEELIGKDIPRFFYRNPEDRSRLIEVLMQKGSVQNYPVILKRADGSFVEVETNSHLIYDEWGRIAGIEGAVREVTERNRIENRIKESELRYRELVEHSVDIIYTLDFRGIITSISPVITRDLGYLPDDVIGKNISDYITPASFERAKEEISLKHAQKRETSRYEIEIRAKDGSLIPYEVNSRVRYRNGEPADILGSARNITNHKKAETELRKSEEQFRSIVESSPTALYIYTLEPDGSLIFRQANPASDQIIGIDSRILIGKTIEDAFPGLTTTNILAMYKEIALGGIGPQSFEISYEDDRFSGDYSVHCFRIGQNTIAVNFIDISERKKTERALRQINRQLNLLSSITRHDIRNQMVSLNAYLGLSKKTLDDAQKTLDYISREERIVKSIDHQINFTKEFESLGVRPPAWLNVADTITAATKGFDFKDIQLHIMDLDTLEIYADPLLVKVFFNLCDNAIRHGGCDLRNIWFSGHESNEGFILRCADDGDGVAADEKAVIFERGYGKNTGYGLFLIREILSITGITIAENGEPGNGAQFDITVPADVWRLKVSTS